MRRHLAELLHAYEPTAGEAHLLAEMLELLASPGDVLSRRHFEPGHFTASAFVVSADRTALALVHHERLGRWLQPGGHIEPEDADVVAAAVREVEEETGITVDGSVGIGVFDVDVHAIPAHGDEPAHRHYDVRFLSTASSDEMVAGDGVAAVRWVPIADVASLVRDRSIVRAARKLLPPG